MLIIQFIILLAVIAAVWWYKTGRHLHAMPNQPGFLIHRTENKKGKTTSLFLGLDRGSAVSLIVRPQRWYDNFLLSLGLTHEVKLNDPLDEHLYFMSDHAPALSHIVRKSEIGTKLVELYKNHKIKKLYFLENRIYGRLEPGEIDHVKFCNDLSEFSHFLDQTKDDPLIRRVERKRFSNMLAALVVMSAHLTLLFYGVAGGAATAIDDKVTLLSNFSFMTKVCLLPGLALWFFMILALFSRTSWLGIVLADFVLIGIAGLLLSGTLLVREINIDLDGRAPEETIVSATYMSCEIECKKRCGRRCTRYEHYPYSWQACKSQALRNKLMEKLKARSAICANKVYVDRLDITVSPVQTSKTYIKNDHTFDAEADVFDRTQPNAKMVMPISPGLLDIPWVDEMKIVPLAGR